MLSSSTGKKIRKGRLTVTTVPESASVRILNIKPKYSAAGMELLAGRYHVEALAAGFKRKALWVRLMPGEDVELTVYMQPQSEIKGEEQKHSENSEEIHSEMFRGEEIGVRFIHIPKGSFVMGGPRYNEGPIHTEFIEHDFYIMNTEVSVRQYALFAQDVGKGSSSYILSAANQALPVVNVSWQDAVDFAAWLSDISGDTYRLPTEAEWEYAAKMGMPEGQGLIKYPCKIQGKSVEVTKAWKNIMGIYGMPGNVWEWCLDCWTQRYQKGKKMHVDRCGNRVIRGGSWRDSAKQLSPVSRNGVATGTKAKYIGFRLVRQD
jgi:serine/threonine-protein kinase PpkA